MIYRMRVHVLTTGLQYIYIYSFIANQWKLINRVGFDLIDFEPYGIDFKLTCILGWKRGEE